MKTTHPDIASLVTPLYASRIEGVERVAYYSPVSEQNNFPNPLSAEGEERVGQRSVAGVSQITTTLNTPQEKPFLINAQPSKPKNLLNPLSAEGEERVGQRSVAGVSQITTTLNTPQEKPFLINAQPSKPKNLLNPLSAEGEEKVGQRSVVGVSQITTTLKPILK